jgi:hypothetical protein
MNHHHQLATLTACTSCLTALLFFLPAALLQGGIPTDPPPCNGGIVSVMLPGAVPAATARVVKSIDLPDVAPVRLKPIGQLEPNANIEPSGMVRSRTWEGVYWTHNDSGDGPRIYAHDRTGRIIHDGTGPRNEGILIPDAVNVDWEDMTIDNLGHLIIGDVGNRDINTRRDFCLYWIMEPHPATSRATTFRRVFFTYPDYPHFSQLPAAVRNFDCEGIFWANGKVYIITKNRSDTHTSLYRLDAEKPHELNVLTYLDTFAIGGRTTAADATPDGSKLVITTYTAIWLFEVEPGRDNYFDGRISWLPIDTWVAGERMQSGQNEAACIDGDHILLSSGEGIGNLYEVLLSDLIPVRR